MCMCFKKGFLQPISSLNQPQPWTPLNVPVFIGSRNLPPTNPWTLETGRLSKELMPQHQVPWTFGAKP